MGEPAGGGGAEVTAATTVDNKGHGGSVIRDWLRLHTSDTGRPTRRAGTLRFVAE